MNNDYLEEVVERQADLQRNLKHQSHTPGVPTEVLEQLAAEPGREDDAPSVYVRVTGFFPWKTVIVPPNAYVVHTRWGNVNIVNLHLQGNLTAIYDCSIFCFVNPG